MILLSLMSSFFELFGLGMFLPIFEILQDGESFTQSDNIIIHKISSLLSYFGISTSIGSILILTFLLFLSSKVLLLLIIYYKSLYIGIIVKNVKDRLLASYLRSDSSFFDKLKIGSFVNKTVVEVPSAVGGLFVPVQLIVTLITGLGSITFLMIISPFLTLFTIIVVFLALIYPFKWVRNATIIGKKNTKYNSFFNTYLIQRLKSLRLIRNNLMTEDEIMKYSHHTNEMRKLTLAIHILKAKLDAFIEPSIVAISLLMIYVSLVYLKIDPSMILLYMAIMVRLVPISKTFLSQIQLLNRSRGAIEEVDKLINDLDENEKFFSRMTSINKTQKSINKITSVELKNVSFKYNFSKVSSLKNINLRFGLKSLNAIIGESGSGKSTLVDIISLYRFPTNGELLINNEKYSNFKFQTIIQNIAFVPQDPQIFAETIREHISYGGNYSDKEIISAAKLSGAYDFIKLLPDKFETKIQEDGKNFSGGQKQRIELTRSLISNSSILILDEPTGNLDKHSEKSFMQSVYSIRQQTDKIIILISHGINTLSNFDSISILENGRIKDFGTHEELLESSKWYQDSIKNNHF